MSSCIYCVCFLFQGPIKVYSSENDISVPYTCILKKLANQQTYGITVKGDCPVRVNFVDPKSCAYVSKCVCGCCGFVNEGELLYFQNYLFIFSMREYEKEII